MSIFCIALLKFVLDPLESWLRWLKNSMYKHEGLSLYPQEIQEWLFIPLISSGGAEGLRRTDLAGFLASQMRKTKQKQNRQANKECSTFSERSCSKEIRPRVSRTPNILIWLTGARVCTQEDLYRSQCIVFC